MADNASDVLLNFIDLFNEEETVGENDENRRVAESLFPQTQSSSQTVSPTQSTLSSAPSFITRTPSSSAVMLRRALAEIEFWRERAERAEKLLTRAKVEVEKSKARAEKSKARAEIAESRANKAEMELLLERKTREKAVADLQQMQSDLKITQQFAAGLIVRSNSFAYSPAVLSEFATENTSASFVSAKNEANYLVDSRLELFSGASILSPYTSVK